LIRLFAIVIKITKLIDPVVAGIVSNTADYAYSSAINYTGKTGLIEIDLWF